MRGIALGVLALAAVVMGCAKSPEPEPRVAEQPPPTEAKPEPPKPASEVPAALQELFKKQNALHKRHTGALLTITAKWEETPMSGPSLRVHWSIDYNGPRRPFTILNPSHNGSTEGRTTVHLWYLQNDGTPASIPFVVGGGVSWPPHPKQKEWFAISAEGKPVGGAIILGNGAHLKQRFEREPSPGSPPLWVQLEHAPTDRGDANASEFGFAPEHWTLDAWTGRLWSYVAEVLVK